MNNFSEYKDQHLKIRNRELGLRGVEKIKWSFLEHHEKRVVGIVLVALGTLIYFMEV